VAARELTGSTQTLGDDLEDRPGALARWGLGQPGYPRPLAELAHTPIRLDLAHHEAQQGRLATAVTTDQRDPLVGLDDECAAVDERLRPDLELDVAQGEQHSGSCYLLASFNGCTGRHLSPPNPNGSAWCRRQTS